LDIDLLITVIDKTIRQKRRKVKNTQRERGGILQGSTEEEKAGRHSN